MGDAGFMEYKTDNLQRPFLHQQCVDQNLQQNCLRSIASIISVLDNVANKWGQISHGKPVLGYKCVRKEDPGFYLRWTLDSRADRNLRYQHTCI